MVAVPEDGMRLFLEWFHPPVLIVPVRITCLGSHLQEKADVSRSLLVRQRFYLYLGLSNMFRE